MKDVLRAAIAVPKLRVADVAFNADEIIKKINEAHEAGVTLLVFPELALTGATCGDLFVSDLLSDRVREALCLVASAVPASMLVSVGAPLVVDGMLCDCAFLLTGDAIVGAVPKTFFAESSRFVSGRDLGARLATVGCFTFPVDTDLLFRAVDGTTVGVAFGDDLSAPLSPAASLALAGAEILLCPAADNETVHRRERRRRTVTERSAETLSACLFVSAGTGESVSDALYAGHGLMALCGSVETESEDLIADDYLLTADLDLGRLRHDRLRNKLFVSCVARSADAEDFQIVDLPLPLAVSDGKRLSVSRLPFVPDCKAERHARCLQIFRVQAAALARRLTVAGGKPVIGISGGLDSTLALLAAAEAMKRAGLPATDITAITMPCFGTSDATHDNALELMQKLGVTAREIPVKEAVLQHFRDIGHDPNDYSVTYENSQARERTQVLMDVANQVGGFVLGTGDLSELALGWCTYNGDHMSMYDVNAGVPKTLIRSIIEAVVEEGLWPDAAPALRRVLDTPISPELLPPDAVGNIAQKTEELVGPYALHDFFLYYTVRFGYRPGKIFALASLAFEGLFDGATIKKWLGVFCRRFFSQQFKRNCMPDGVGIGSVGLSPRGAWQMPADAAAAEWQKELDEIEV